MHEVVVIQLNCAAEHLCRPCYDYNDYKPFFKSHISFGEWIISFGRAKTPLRKQQSNNKASNYIAPNLHKLASCVFFGGLTSENLRPLRQFMKKYWRYLFTLTQGRRIFKKKLIYNGRCGFMFGYLFWSRTRLVRVTQHDFFSSLT